MSLTRFYLLMCMHSAMLCHIILLWQYVSIWPYITQCNYYLMALYNIIDILVSLSVIKATYVHRNASPLAFAGSITATHNNLYCLLCDA